MKRNWVPAPNSAAYAFGRIAPIDDPFDPALRFGEGEIRLPVGDVSFGQIHLHSAGRVMRYAPLSPEHYVFQVTSAYDEIWFQAKTAGLLLVRNAHTVGRRAVAVSRSWSEGIYHVVTAFPLDRDHNFKRRRETLVWRRD